jgi:hypothetical protein
MTFLHNTSTNRRGQSPLAVRATSLTCVLLDRRGTLVGYCTRNHTGVHPWSVRELKPNPFINRRGRIKVFSIHLSPLYRAVHAACEEDRGFVRLPASLSLRTRGRFVNAAASRHSLQADPASQ